MRLQAPPTPAVLDYEPPSTGHRYRHLLRPFRICAFLCLLSGGCYMLTSFRASDRERRTCRGGQARQSPSNFGLNVAEVGDSATPQLLAAKVAPGRKLLLVRCQGSSRITDRHSLAGTAPTSFRITRTIPPGRSSAVLGYTRRRTAMMSEQGFTRFHIRRGLFGASELVVDHSASAIRAAVVRLNLDCAAKVVQCFG